MNVSFDAGNMRPGSASVNQSDATRICRKGLKEASFIPPARKLCGSEETGGAADICKSSKKQQTVSFAPDYQVIQLDDDQTEDIKSLWYSRYDYMVFENEACLCSEVVRASASQGSFDNELDDILGLEKIIFYDSFYEYRYALRAAVMEEQALQLVNEKAQRKVEDLLADTSERYSLWAREQASLYAFTLEHDLGTSKGVE
jgi:hypothetical protein